MDDTQSPTARPEMGVADVLNKAADLLEPEGAWTQGVYGRSSSGAVTTQAGVKKAACRCMIGALFAASDERSIYDLEHSAAYQVLVSHLSVEDEPTDWNDAPGRTQAEVVAALRQAAKQAEQSATPIGEA